MINTGARRSDAVRIGRQSGEWLRFTAWKIVTAAQL
nr:DUF3225 domain-containing protein [Ensifer sp. BR816]